MSKDIYLLNRKAQVRNSDLQAIRRRLQGDEMLGHLSAFLEYANDRLGGAECSKMCAQDVAQGEVEYKGQLFVFRRNF